MIVVGSYNTDSVVSPLVFGKTSTTDTDKLILHKSNNDSGTHWININTILFIVFLLLLLHKHLIADICTSLSSSDLNNSVSVKWTDANAVKTLISKWQNHENDFKNTQMRNSMANDSRWFEKRKSLMELQFYSIREQIQGS